MRAFKCAVMVVALGACLPLAGITVLGFNLLYQPFRHIGFGIGYTALFLSFQADSTGLGSFQGKLNQNVQGPSFYVTGSF